MSSPEEVSRVTIRCLNAFEDVQRRAAPLSDEHVWAEDQGARLRMWAAILGVSARGRMSIAYRLRLNAPMVIMISQLLESIESCLKSILSMEARGDDDSRTGLGDMTGNSLSFLWRVMNPFKGHWRAGPTRVTRQSLQQNAKYSISLLLELASDLRKLATSKEEQRALLYDPVDAENNSLVPDFRCYVRTICQLHLLLARGRVVRSARDELATGSQSSAQSMRGKSEDERHEDEQAQGSKEGAHSVLSGGIDVFLRGLGLPKEDTVSDLDFIELRLRATIEQRWRVLCYRSKHAQLLATEHDEAESLPSTDVVQTSSPERLDPNTNMASAAPL